MKFAAVLLSLSALVAAGNLADLDQRALFEQFKAKFNKQYASAEEEAMRFEHFKTNVVRADGYNKMEKDGGNPTTPYGVTKFMDLSKEEFKKKYLNKVDFASNPRSAPATLDETTLPTGPFPATFDWKQPLSGPMCVTRVKNQGQCGSCWAFSGVETLESVSCLAGYPLMMLSEQQIVDCDTNGGVQGCNGGWPEDVYTYVQTFGGLDTAKQYPYVAQDQNCAAVNTGFDQFPVTSWKFISQKASQESLMQPFLFANSPLSIGADAEPWQTYVSGVITAASCGNQVDHAIQITGWTVMSGMNVWTVRNSWAADWGMDGYVYLQMGKNTCACATHVTVPCITGTGNQTGKTIC